MRNYRRGSENIYFEFSSVRRVEKSRETPFGRVETGNFRRRPSLYDFEIVKPTHKI